MRDPVHELQEAATQQWQRRHPVRALLARITAAWHRRHKPQGPGAGGTQLHPLEQHQPNQSESEAVLKRWREHLVQLRREAVARRYTPEEIEAMWIAINPPDRKSHRGTHQPLSTVSRTVRWVAGLLRHRKRKGDEGAAR